MILLHPPHPSANPALAPPVFRYLLSSHIDPHSAPVSPLFLTLSSKTPEGEGARSKNPRQTPFSSAAIPSLRAGILRFSRRRLSVLCVSALGFSPRSIGLSNQNSPEHLLGTSVRLSVARLPSLFTLFCSRAKHISYPLNDFRTLFQNTPGGRGLLGVISCLP